MFPSVGYIDYELILNAGWFGVTKQNIAVCKIHYMKYRVRCWPVGGTLTKRCGWSYSHGRSSCDDEAKPLPDNAHLTEMAEFRSVHAL